MCNKFFCEGWRSVARHPHDVSKIAGICCDTVCATLCTAIGVTARVCHEVSRNFHSRPGCRQKSLVRNSGVRGEGSNFDPHMAMNPRFVGSSFENLDLLVIFESYSEEPISRVDKQGSHLKLVVAYFCRSTILF